MIKFLDELGNFKQNTLQNVKLFYILKQRTHTYYLNLFVRLNTISSYLGTLDVLWIKVLLKCKKNCYGCCNVAYVTEMFCHTCYTFFWIFLTFTVISFFLHLIIPFVLHMWQRKSFDTLGPSDPWGPLLQSFFCFFNLIHLGLCKMIFEKKMYRWRVE